MTPTDQDLIARVAAFDEELRASVPTAAAAPSGPAGTDVAAHQGRGALFRAPSLSITEK